MPEAGIGYRRRVPEEPPPNLLIRPMRIEDVATAQEISNDAFYDLGTRTTRAHWPAVERRSEARAEGWRVRSASLLTSDPEGCWVGELDGRIVGFSISFRRETTWFLASYGVRPGFQRQGIGRPLLDAALSYSTGCLHAMFHASEDPGATRRYVAAGFELHPMAMLSGTPDLRNAPDLYDIRLGDVTADCDLFDSLDRRTRGAAHGVDHEWLGTNFASIVIDRHDRSGYAYVSNGAPVVLAASNRRTARDLFWAALRMGDGSAISVSHISGANQWAIAAGVAASLMVDTEGFLALRGMKPPAPYIGHGALM